MKLYELAVGGDVSAICEYNRRRFGNPPTQVDISGDGAEVRFVIEPARQVTPEQWLAEHVESQREIAAADMGMDPGDEAAN